MKNYTRRTFIKGMTATGAVIAASPLFDMNKWVQAQAVAPVKRVPSMCNACSSHCGIWVHVKAGRVWKVTGHADHPRSRGKLCARAHGGISWLYDPNRVTVPLKRVGDRFIPLSWDEAMADIATKLKNILDTAGPSAVFYAHNPRQTGVFYGQRFMDSIGSPTVCTHNAACNTSLTRGFSETFGWTPGTDMGGAKYILCIGRNYGEGIRTSQATGLMAAIAKGTKVVCVDPRLNATAAIASEWIPIRPGADLALVLAMSNVLITEELYDKEFIKTQANGFEEFVAANRPFTPEWAAPLTDIPAETIRRMAREMAAVRPNCHIDPSWKGAFGTNYINSTQTARAVGLLNALLGNPGAPGGLTYFPGVRFGSLDKEKHPAPPRPTIPRSDGVGVKGEFPLGTSHGLPHVLAKKAKEGKVKAGIIWHHNPVRNFPDRKHMVEGYRSLDLLVVIDTHLRETGMAATHILPEVSFLEREEVVEGYGGRRPAIATRVAAVPKLHPLTRTYPEILTDLATRLGHGKFFNFTLDELNEAQIAPLKVSLATLKEKGSLLLEAVEVPAVPPFTTASKKVDFFSKRLADNGFAPCPVWEAPLVEPDRKNPASFRLIHGKQGYHSHSATVSIPYLQQISKDYDAERLWLNAERAKVLGIKDGDTVLVTSKLASQKVKVKVTNRLHPEAAYLPAGYGTFSPFQPNADGYGISANDFVPFMTEPLVGHAMMHEVVVEIKKV
ncbi:MAG: molybdopterin-dependent oxidoreductase [Smithellaceae bacterium]|nr:molybdopterin-dependent oxidoreductase [Smithellaceae bacterium]